MKGKIKLGSIRIPFQCPVSSSSLRNLLVHLPQRCCREYCVHMAQSPYVKSHSRNLFHIKVPGKVLLILRDPWVCSCGQHESHNWAHFPRNNWIFLKGRRSHSYTRGGLAASQLPQHARVTSKAHPVQTSMGTAIPAYALEPMGKSAEDLSKLAHHTLARSRSRVCFLT